MTKFIINKRTAHEKLTSNCFLQQKKLKWLQCNAPYHEHPTNFHTWQQHIITSAQQPIQQCYTYNAANFERRRDCQSNWHTLIGGYFIKNFLRRPRQGTLHCNCWVKMQKTAVNMNFTQIEANIVISISRFLISYFRQPKKISLVKSWQFDSWSWFLHKLEFYLSVLLLMIKV